MKRSTTCICAFVTTLSLLVQGCANEDPALYEVAYLPYWAHCEVHIDYLKKFLGRKEGDFSITILSPKNPLPIPTPINGLLKVQYLQELRDSSDRVFNGYLSRCGPNGVVESKIDSLSEDSLRRILSNAPGGYGNYQGEFLIQVSGDTTSLFYTQVR